MYNYRIGEFRIFPGDKAFWLMDSQGIPIETLLFITNEKGFVIRWTEFFKEAKKSPNFNKNIQKLFNRCLQASKDAGYSDGWWEERIKNESEHYKYA